MYGLHSSVDQAGCGCCILGRWSSSQGMQRVLGLGPCACRCAPDALESCPRSTSLLGEAQSVSLQRQPQPQEVDEAYDGGRRVAFDKVPTIDFEHSRRGVGFVRRRASWDEVGADDVADR